MDHLLGQSAAIFASVLWTFTSLVFAASSKRIGALNLNAWRIAFAVVLLTIAHIILLGSLLPQASQGEWFWLSLSGVIGLAVGDFAFFACLVYIGPRKGVLLLGQAPIFTLIGAYLVHGELPGAWALLGVMVTLAGVFIVLVDRQMAPKDENRPTENKEMKEPSPTLDEESELSKSNSDAEMAMDPEWSQLSDHDKRMGLFLGFVAAFGQGIGLVVAELGNEDVDPLSVSLIRMLAAFVVVWLGVLLSGRMRGLFQAAKDRKGIGLAGVGAIIGPFLGVWSIMVAIDNTYTGIAATLSSLAPVMIIPVLWIGFKQQPSWRGILGALVSVVGVAIIFLM